MREDMFKVIVERPRMRIPKRNGSHYPRGELKKAWSCDLGDAPRREGMGRGYRYKCLNENLAPLRRFLQSRVGRPWDAVYSELCEHLSLNSAVQKHVLEHLDNFVARKTREINGRLYEVDTYGRELELQPHRRQHGRLYVCPRTGLLRDWQPKRRTPLYPGREIDAQHDIRKIDGTWYLIRFAPVPVSRDVRLQTYDVVTKESLPYWPNKYSSLLRVWNRQDRYACGMKPLKRKEYRRLLGG